MSSLKRGQELFSALDGMRRRLWFMLAPTRYFSVCWEKNINDNLKLRRDSKTNINETILNTLKNA